MHYFLASHKTFPVYFHIYYSKEYLLNFLFQKSLEFFFSQHQFRFFILQFISSLENRQKSRWEYSSLCDKKSRFASLHTVLEYGKHCVCLLPIYRTKTSTVSLCIAVPEISHSRNAAVHFSTASFNGIKKSIRIYWFVVQFCFGCTNKELNWVFKHSRRSLSLYTSVLPLLMVSCMLCLLDSLSVSFSIAHR